MNQTEQRPSQVTATLAGEADLGDVLALENRFLDEERKFTIAGAI